ncbi:hypothetical protein HORM4_280014 [Vibrio harveyi]|nr:hypothetical protein HORM4_280014 [Vibrio harveyi]
MGLSQESATSHLGLQRKLLLRLSHMKRNPVQSHISCRHPQAITLALEV